MRSRSLRPLLQCFLPPARSAREWPFGPASCRFIQRVLEALITTCFGMLRCLIWPEIHMQFQTSVPVRDKAVLSRPSRARQRADVSMKCAYHPEYAVGPAAGLVHLGFPNTADSITPRDHIQQILGAVHQAFGEASHHDAFLAVGFDAEVPLLGVQQVIHLFVVNLHIKGARSRCWPPARPAVSLLKSYLQIRYSDAECAGLVACKAHKQVPHSVLDDTRLSFCAPHSVRLTTCSLAIRENCAAKTIQNWLDKMLG